MDEWKNSLLKSLKDFPKSELRKLIDTQPIVMEEIIHKNGNRTKY